MKSLVLAALVAGCASGAWAEDSVEPLQPNLRGQSVECASFRHDAGGTWTALKDLPVQRQNEYTTVAAGTVIRPGGPAIAGLDVGRMLDTTCPH